MGGKSYFKIIQLESPYKEVLKVNYQTIIHVKKTFAANSDTYSTVTTTENTKLEEGGNLSRT